MSTPSRPSRLAIALTPTRKRGGPERDRSLALVLVLVLCIAAAPTLRFTRRAGSPSVVVPTWQQASPTVRQALLGKSLAIGLRFPMLTFDCGDPHGRPLILMFHRVVPRRELQARLVARPRFEMSTQRFAEVLREMPELGYSFVSLDELVARLTRGGPTHHLAAITFDDGFSDVVQHALPLLEQHRAPFTTYVTTGYPERRLMHISAAIEDLVVRHTDRLELELLGSRVQLPTSTRAEKAAALQHLEGLAFSRFASIADAARAFGFDPLAYASCVLGWDELSMLARHPLCTLGAHTANHPDLSSQPRDKVRSELTESNALLAALLGSSPVHFAYPFGKYDDVARDEGFRAGYRVMVRTGRACVDPLNLDLGALPRACVLGEMQA